MKTSTIFRTVAGSALAAAILVLSPAFANAETNTQSATISDAAKNEAATKDTTFGEYIDDAAITTAVKGKFLSQKGLDSLDISVETTNGVVVLTGAVDNEAQVNLAENAAKQVNGVKKVVNKLTVKK